MITVFDYCVLEQSKEQVQMNGKIVLDSNSLFSILCHFTDF